MNNNIDYKRLDMVGKLLDKFVEDNECAGCSCLVIKDGRELVYHEAGMRDIENNLPITRDTIFRMFSLSKISTSIAVMQLMENGLIDLLDPVSKYLPGFRNQKCYENGRLVSVKKEVTIKNLLDMTSGLCYPGENYEAERDASVFFEEALAKLHTDEEMTTLEIANAIGKLPLAFEPGSRWNYGSSADILGAIVELVSGIKYSEYLKKNIFEPLEMFDTGFFVPNEKQDRLAKTYGVSGAGLNEFTGEFLLIQHRMKEEPRFESGGAGLTSTIDDYSRIAMMLLNNGEYKGRRILHPETIRFMTAGSLNEIQQASVDWESLIGYSYGNMLRVMKDTGRACSLGSVGEYGWDGWAGTYLANIPEHNMCILYMMQRSETGTIDLTRKLRNLVFSAIV